MILLTAVRAASAAVGLVAAVDIVAIDARRKKIPNGHLLAFFSATMVLYSLLAYSLGSQAGLFFRAGALHLLVACAASVGLWRLGLWPAGDAKLFILVAALLPAVKPDALILSWRLTLACLMNVFIPAAAFLLLGAARWAWSTRLRHEARFFKALGVRRLWDYLATAQSALGEALMKSLRDMRESLRRDPAGSALSAAQMFCMVLVGASWTSFASRMGWSLLAGPMAGFFMILAWRACGDAIGNRAMGALSLAAAVAAFYSASGDQRVLLWEGLVRWGGFMAAMSLGMFAIRFLFGIKQRFMALFWIALMLVPAAPALGWVFWGAICGLGYVFLAAFLEEDVNILPLTAVRPNMVLAPSTVESLREDPDYFEKHFSRLYPDGLTSDQTRALKEWAGERALGMIAFRRTRPFAVWIFVGGALTLILGQDVISALRGGLALR